ncbi:MAG: SDR family NAD(P)-dependent oxidoreductase [Methylococcales bacterium]|nr:SDR family NAD(P)-dependent oxidoreductase [Methylococcales bacterium]
MKAFDGIKRKDIQWSRDSLIADSLFGIKVAIIGGTNGIGRLLALEMISKGAEVLVVGRTFRDDNIPRLSFMKADLSQMKEAKRITQQLPAETLDMVFFTAGIMAGKQRSESDEGIEIDLAVSYLNRFVMIREISERLGKDRNQDTFKPRVFVWGFPGTNQKGNLSDFNSEKSYSLMSAHSNTVIGNEALVLDSALRFPKINFFGMNPGLMKSNIRSSPLGEGSWALKITEMFIGTLFPSVETYSRRILPLLVSHDIENHSGAMFNRHGHAIHTSKFLSQQSGLANVIEQSERLAARALR